MGNGEQVQGMGKYKMGTKPNLNPSPISNLISNSLFYSHFSFSHFVLKASFPTAHYPLK